MRFTIDIDVDALTGEPRQEIARILRFWAGALPKMELAAGLDQELMDSAYASVGSMRLSG